MDYVRQPAPSTLPGLTEEETREMYQIDVEGMMYGYHSLSAEKIQRLLELQMRIVEKEQQ